MHNAVKNFIREVKKDFPHLFRLRKILEVGSHSINGSPRSFFLLCDYTGVDIGSGKGVDISGRFISIQLPYDFEVIVSTEMLEHDSDWQQSLRRMYDLLLPGGLLIITSAGPERKEHGTFKTDPSCSPDTTDYYRNISKEDFRSVLSPDMFGEYVLQYSRGEADLQFYGLKPKDGTRKKRNLFKALINSL